jgi:Fur family transcriptional regulator, ferric uptake regulator
MTHATQEIASFLKHHHLSVTKQRLAVFGLLEGREPLSMSDLYELAKDYLDRASLYRTVAVFEELGIVRRVSIGWKYKLELSDRFTEHHHHLTCLKCHKVVSISEEELEAFVGTLSTKYAFKPVEHQIEVQGYCEDCSDG